MEYELQNKTGPQLLTMIREGKVSYNQVDKALEKVKRFSALDWIGDQLANDELNK